MALKVVIVGCGNIADGHVEAVQRGSVSTVVAVCDRERLMAEQLAARYGIERYYDDLARMLEETAPDVVHVTTPPQSHLELATRAIDAGCHVYVEKPLTVTEADARALIDHARSRGRKLTVGHIYQFDPPAHEVRRLVERGVIGDPVHIESYYGYNIDGAFGRAMLETPHHWVHALPGKIAHENVSHALSKVVEFLPDAPTTVRAVATRRVEGRFGDVRDELIDELRVALMAGRTSAYVTFSSHAKPVGHFLRIHGTRNTVLANYVTRTVTLERGPRLPSALGRLLPAFVQGRDYRRQGWKNLFRFARSEFHFFAGMNELVERFHRCIIDDTEVPIAYEEMLRVAALTDRIFEELAGQDGGNP